MLRREGAWRWLYMQRLVGWSHGEALLDVDQLLSWLLMWLGRTDGDHSFLAALLPLLQLSVTVATTHGSHMSMYSRMSYPHVTSDIHFYTMK